MSGPRRPQPGSLAGAVVGVAVLALGLLTGRSDLAVLGVPLLAGAVVVGRARRRAGAPVELRVEPSADAASLGVRVGVTAPPGSDLVVVRYRAFGGETNAIVVAPARAEALVGRLPAVHSGPQQVLVAEARGVGPIPVAEPETVAVDAVLAPLYRPITALPVPRGLRRPNGIHESRRAGIGGDFRDLHPFTPGDRLRRIDWRATARLAGSGADLVVKRTEDVAEASIAVVIDARDDVGARVADWYDNVAAGRGRGSLDIGREAAASIAAGYLAAGDRVAFADLADPGRGIPAGGGRRHLDRIVAALATAAPSTPVERSSRVPTVPGVVVHLVSTFLDDDPATAARAWLAEGRRVVLVDVLPEPLLDGADDRHRTAHRMLRLEREHRLRVLRDLGAEPLRWDAADRDARLAVIARERGR